MVHRVKSTVWGARSSVFFIFFLNSLTSQTSVASGGRGGEFSSYLWPHDFLTFLRTLAFFLRLLACIPGIVPSPLDLRGFLSDCEALAATALSAYSPSPVHCSWAREEVRHPRPTMTARHVTGGRETFRWPSAMQLLMAKVFTCNQYLWCSCGG